MCLAMMTDGIKLKPFVVSKGIWQDQELLYYPGVVVTYSHMNEQTTKTWYGEHYHFKEDC